MFTKRIKILNILGIPIYVDLSWFVIVVLIAWSLATSLFPVFYEDLSGPTYWGMGVAGALGLFASILAHELGHSVVARQFGVPMRGITLFIFGGVAEMPEEPPSPKAEFLVAIAGPAVSVAIALGCVGLAVFGRNVFPGSVLGVLWYLGVINGVVVGFNLIPAFPLDGGRVLRALLWEWKGSLRWATRVTAALGSGFGLFLMLLGAVSFISGNVVGGMWQFLIGLFVRNAAQMSYQQLVIRKALEGESVERFMRTNVVSVAPETTVQDLVDNYIYKFHHKLFPVVDNGRLTGCVTTRAVQQLPRNEWSERTVGEIAEVCGDQNTIARHVDATQALSKMSRVKGSRLMVVRGDQLEGIVSLKDLLTFIALKVELEEEENADFQSPLG